MRVKRALKLDSCSMEKGPATPLVRKKKNLKSYSPTTGTCVISPFSSPRSNNVREHRNDLSNGSRKEVHDLLKSSSKQGQLQVEKNDKFLVVQPVVEDSLERFMQLRRKLTNLQALEGTRELENVMGVLDNSCNLKSEVRKNRKLLEQVRKLKQLRRNHGGLPARESHQPVNSFEFLKSIIE
ncbi:centromere protein R [Eublepharis macularius]|uniref:Centromere protein R n=1 Tax=Eublepharis macularius TaxID=481883 RepID=A0AA97JI40_EUBMA|nr:centromere protein R [Eublepharis macularius]